MTIDTIQTSVQAIDLDFCVARNLLFGNRMMINRSIDMRVIVNIDTLIEKKNKRLSVTIIAVEIGFMPLEARP